ncbi:hypothetical protein ES708_22110 [subsurface metagenome]
MPFLYQGDLMPVEVSPLTTLESMRCRAVFYKNGAIYVILLDMADHSLRCFKKSDGAFSEQDTANRPLSVAFTHYYDGKFDGRYVHIVYPAEAGKGYAIKYILFDTLDDQWGTPETIDSDIGAPPRNDVGISLDSNQKPHVCYNYAAKVAGVTYAYARYANKTAPTWSAPERVQPNNATDNCNFACEHQSDDRFIVIWAEIDDGMFCRTRSSDGVWDTPKGVGYTIIPGPPSLAIDINDKRYCAYREYGRLFGFWCAEANPGASQIWEKNLDDDRLGTNAEAVPSLSIKIGATDLYYLYTDRSSKDVLLIKNEGAGWTSPETLQTAIFCDRVCAQNPTSSASFSYIWRERDDLKYYWDEYTLAPPLINLAGQITGVASLSAALLIITKLSATIATLTTLTASISITRTLTGIAHGATIVTGLLRATRSLAGVSSGLSSITSTLSTITPLSATISGSTIVTALLTSIKLVTRILHVRHPALLSVIHMRGEKIIREYHDLSSLDDQYLTKQVGLDVAKGDAIEATTVAGISYRHQV